MKVVLSNRQDMNSYSLAFYKRDLFERNLFNSPSINYLSKYVLIVKLEENA